MGYSKGNNEIDEYCYCVKVFWRYIELLLFRCVVFEVVEFEFDYVKEY